MKKKTNFSASNLTRKHSRMCRDLVMEASIGIVNDMAHNLPVSTIERGPVFSESSLVMLDENPIIFAILD